MDEITLARLIDECREEQEHLQLHDDRSASVSELTNMQLDRVDRSSKNILEA